MMRWILVGLLALGCASVGEAVECYSCPFGLCVLPTTTSCYFGQLCGTTKATMSTILGDISIKAKGCIGLFKCLAWQSETYQGMKLSASNSCCFGSLCNSSTSARPSLLTGLVALLAVLLMKLL